LPLNNTGITEIVAKTISITTEVQERIDAEEVNFWSVVPACIATNEGGATPMVRQF
jgi:hypothetical protein